MNSTLLLAGATGLVGSSLLHLLKNDRSFEKVIVLTRREILAIKELSHIEQQIIDFNNLEKYAEIIAAETVVCALGSTIKKAGSKENFRQVDYQLPLDIAQHALRNGAGNYLLVSAIGADAHSKVFYNRVKGELERDLQQLSFSGIHILRPSLLLGERDEFRLGEELGKILVKPLSFLIPPKYRPIHAESVAKKMLDIARDPAAGIHLYEGKQLLHLPHA